MSLDLSQVKKIELPLYKQLEYIYFNGTNNFINTGEIPSNKYNYREITVKDVGRTGSYAFMFFGNNDGTDKDGVFIGVEGYGALEPHALEAANGYYEVELYDDYTNAPLTQKVTYGVYCEDWSSGIYTGRTVAFAKDVNGNTLATHYRGYNNNVTEDFPNRSLYLMANNHPSGTGWYTYGKLYRYKRYSSYGGTLQADFIPCQRQSDGKLGFYDSVGQTFHDLKGTASSASAGPIVASEIVFPTITVNTVKTSNNTTIWSAYRRLEYLETSGTGPQAIDTGFAPDRTSYMMLRVADKNVPDGSQGRGAVQNQQRFAAGYKQGGFFFGLGNGWIGPVGTAGTDPHTIGVQGPECNVLNNAVGTSTKKQGYYIDGTFTENTNTYPASDITWYTIYILGSKGNVAGDIQQTIPCKMYWAEYGHTSGTSKVIDKKLYPCQRKSDGQLGFYDTVNNTFIYQLVSGSDSGTISAGPVADECWDLTAPSN